MELSSRPVVSQTQVSVVSLEVHEALPESSKDSPWITHKAKSHYKSSNKSECIKQLMIIGEHAW